MSTILEPLIEAGTNGCLMANGNGVIHRAHTIYACFIGDYPEQVQCTCVVTGDCVQCPTPRNELGEFDAADAASLWRPLAPLLAALKKDDKDPVRYRQLAQANRVKPLIAPFWKNLPHFNVYQSITPDVLHQMYQGVIKHIISWATEACGRAEIDARCRRLPPNHNIHLFLKGITTLSRVSGKEHAKMCQILLGLVINISLPNNLFNIPLIRAIRAILDFLYLAQYPVHTSETLKLMEDSLANLHQHKHIFVQLGLRDNFNIPKLHFISHYVRCIKLFGTTDNFNTEYTERLHIDLAKDAYHATNYKDEYTQMTRWLEQKEKMCHHDQYIRWQQAKETSSALVADDDEWVAPGLDQRRYLKISKAPASANVPLDLIRSSSGYGATHFVPALSRYIALFHNPNLTRHQLDREVFNMFLPFRTIAVWNSFKFQREDPLTKAMTTVDIIHAYAASNDSQKRPVPVRFDTVLINSEEATGLEVGVRGRRIGRIRLIFSLSPKIIAHMFTKEVQHKVLSHFAYV
jgi:hypothetical protein